MEQHNAATPTGDRLEGESKNLVIQVNALTLFAPPNKTPTDDRVADLSKLTIADLVKQCKNNQYDALLTLHTKSLWQKIWFLGIF